jgi:hypothetical protein
MNKSTTAKSAVRQPRRALLLAGGLLAATSILAGAGPASAGPILGPVIITADSPTSAFCPDPGKCTVWDKNGIDRVIRYKDAWHTSTTILLGSPTQTTVENTGGVYVEFEVIDKLGVRTKFKFPVVG